MIAAHERRNASIIAFKRFPPQEISFYGCAEADEEPDGLMRVRSIVEKPKPEDAPSDLGVMGRYVFTPEIFEAIDRTKPGVGGEIQLTDAIGLLLAEQDVFGFVFESGRFDIGKKIDYLRATVELALDREDLGPEFAEFLVECVRRRGLVP
jgi:UTP--glucose-1-phosphate uridylyltransferase